LGNCLTRTRVWAAAFVWCGLVAFAGAQAGARPDAQAKGDLPQAPEPNIAKLPGGVVVERADSGGVAS